MQDISWFSINFQKILRFSLPGFTIIFKKIHGFSLIGFALIFKKYSVPVYSVLTLFSKNIRLDFNRLGDIFKKYSVGFYSVFRFFRENIRFLDYRFYIFFEKIFGFGYSVVQPNILKNIRFFSNRIKNRQPNKKKTCVRPSIC